MFRKTVLAVGVALGLGIASAVSAAPITFSFNPTGGGLGAGVVVGAGIFDEAPGNTLAIGGNVGALTPPPGTRITDLYQANLASITTPTNVNLFSNGSSVGGQNRYFTVVAGFGEVVLPFPFTAGATTAFAFDPTGTTNFFRVYANTVGVGNDLTGAGFTNGTVIMSGHIVDITSSVTVSPSSIGPGPSVVGCGLLDQSPDGNQHGTQTTSCSGGSANLVAVIDSVNTGYFPDMVVGGQITTAITNSSLITPYNQANPSFFFSSNGIASGDRAANVGACNGCSGAGNGPDYEFQSDGNTSFTRAVPEPATLALVGLALAGIGTLRRSRRT